MIISFNSHKLVLFFLWVFLCITSAGGSHFTVGAQYSQDSTFIKAATKRTTCSGTNYGFSTSDLSDPNDPADQAKIMDRLRTIYNGCQIVERNLELNYIQDGADLSFLAHIEEVYGYVLISHTTLKHIALPSLRVVWGDRQFKPVMQESSLELSAERDDISNTSLLVINNPALFTLDLRNLRGTFQCTCTHEISDHCWGIEPAQCQIIYRDKCAPQCSNQMCYRQDFSPTSCCHQECLGGCTGPKDSDCLACQNFLNEGRCAGSCPSPEIYDRVNAEVRPNPNGKYEYLRQCVDVCPDHMLVYGSGCVKRCPFGFTQDSRERKCVKCDGVCPKECISEGRVTALNVAGFENCTEVSGSLLFPTDVWYEGSEFENGQIYKRPALSLKMLRKYLGNIKRVTGYVVIQPDTETLSAKAIDINQFKSIDFLQNLEVIEGRQLQDKKFALDVSHSPFVYLGLRNLRSVINGAIYIAHNKRMCFTEGIPWEEVVHDASGSGRSFGRVVGNLNNETCASDGLVCHDLCNGSKGCWGPGSHMCFECKHWDLDGTCVHHCDTANGFYRPDVKKCAKCDGQCATCFGPTAKDCPMCKYSRFNGKCVFECPTGTYRNATGICEPCSPNCYNGKCSGGGNFAGKYGCDKCHFGVLSGNSTVECLTKVDTGSARCRNLGFHSYYESPPHGSFLTSRVHSFVCLPCHEACGTCDRLGRGVKSHGCTCKYALVVSRNACDMRCPDNTWRQKIPDHPLVERCNPCHPECANCTGPTSFNCGACKHRKLLRNSSETPSGGRQESFSCVRECPDDVPFPDVNGLCHVEDVKLAGSSDKKIALACTTSIAVACLVLLSCFVFWKRKRRSKIMDFDAKSMELQLDPNPEASPNMAKLRLITEPEIKLGIALGHGAFGTVYEGVYKPKNELIKIPVAIKVLHESHPGAQDEMLEEAGRMATLNHVYLLRLIGVCVGHKMMMITPLILLGNLLDYVKKNKQRIGSSALLRWSYQIASGMCHLEEQRVIHRDLAARNVLIKHPDQIKITDFGLSKMLDYKESEYKAGIGRVPVKWLALESLQHKLYTHKSDVWAFGVTIWELLTFGEHPYRDVSPRDMPELLERGERLAQPEGCTLDLYMLLIRCWMVDADSRPSFLQLKENFKRYNLDPSRYVVISGDARRELSCLTPQEQRNELEQIVGRVEEMSEEVAFDPLTLGHHGARWPGQQRSTTTTTTVTGTTDEGSLFRRLMSADQYFESKGELSAEAGFGTLKPGDVVRETMKKSAWSGRANRDSVDQGRNQMVDLRTGGSRRHESTSSNGTKRYASDPLKELRHVPATVSTDVDNYLVPNYPRSDTASVSGEPVSSQDYPPAYVDVIKTPDPAPYLLQRGYYNTLVGCISDSTKLASLPARLASLSSCDDGSSNDAARNYGNDPSVVTRGTTVHNNVYLNSCAGTDYLSNGVDLCYADVGTLPLGVIQDSDSQQESVV